MCSRHSPSQIGKPTRKGRGVDVALPPGGDESAFLVAVLTALCRPSLPLAPAILIRAPALSGAGTGKGLLVCALANIATGESPRAFTSGADRAELDKRLAASLVEAEPLIFLDNVNGTTLRSDLLAQVITENPCSMRLLGRTQMIQLETRAVICITGNSIDVSEDLARRFIIIGLDAKLENPELRRFDGRFLDTIRERRSELMTAALTIWRWGRRKALPRGLPLGSFEVWARWVRDPLLALGCVDPVNRIEEIKRDDPDRRQAVEFLIAWRAEYGDRPVTVAEMHDDLRSIIGSRGATRQAMAQYVNRLVNARIAGFHLIRQPHGKWGASHYILQADEGA
jgi:hypothetical protein